MKQAVLLMETILMLVPETNQYGAMNVRLLAKHKNGCL